MMKKYSFSKCYSHPGRLLSEHLEGVADYIANHTEKSTISYELGICIGLAHDIGKATMEFQEVLSGIGMRSEKSNHSLLSAAIALSIVDKLLPETSIPIDMKLFYQLVSSYAIARHHGNLDNLSRIGRIFDSFEKDFTRDIIIERIDFEGYASWLQEKLADYGIDIKISSEDLLDRDSITNIADWAILDLDEVYDIYSSVNIIELSSLLFQADKLDAAFRGEIPVIQSHIDSELIENYKTMSFSPNPTGLNVYRSEIARAVLDNYLENQDEMIFTLTAPTGSGKTLAALDVAMRMKQDDAPVIYCLPFTSIIDQNYDVLHGVFEKIYGKAPGNDILLKNHHLADTAYSSSENEEFDYDSSEMLITAWQSNIIVTTFVQLFLTIFSGKNRALKKFERLRDAVVILDEVQAIPRNLWELTAKTMKTLSELMGTRFIFMTATQPGILNNIETIELLPENKEYSAIFGRTRLKSNIDEEIDTDGLASIIAKQYCDRQCSIIAVVNTIKDSISLFECLSELLPDADIEYLSTNIIPMDRSARIKKLKESPNPWILISTQVIEAGVDISAEILHRDIAPIDSIVQSAGRCNRNGEFKSGDVYVWKIRQEGKNISAKYVYDNFLYCAAEELLSNQSEFLSEKDMRQIVEQYFDLLQVRGGENNALKYLEEFEYEKLSDCAKLINDDGITNQYFIIRESDAESVKLWEDYLSIKEMDDFFDRRKAFAAIKSDFMQRVVTIREKSNNEWPIMPAYGDSGQYDVKTGFNRNFDDGGFMGC